MRNALKLLLVLFGCFLGAGACIANDENYVTNEYSADWKAVPDGDFGKRVVDPQNSAKEILTLESSDEAVQPHWIIPNLEFESDQSYLLEVTVKADAGVHYRIYLENAGPPAWQNHGIPDCVGDGKIQVMRKQFAFKDVDTKTYLIIQLMSPGSLQILDVRIKRDEEKSKLIANALQIAGEVKLITPGDDDVWTFTADQGGVGDWVKLDRPEKVGISIHNDSEGNPYWSRGELPIESDKSYILSYSVKAEAGQKYRVYIENSSDGRWQSFCGDVHEGNGGWQDYEDSFSFTNITTKCHIVMQVMGTGDVTFSSLRISQ